MNMRIKSKLLASFLAISVAIMGCRTPPPGPMPGSDAPQPHLDRSTGFTPFGFEGGYDCGSIVRIDPVSGDLSVLISLDDWSDGTALLQPEKKPFPTHTYNYGRDIMDAVNAGIGRLAKVESVIEKSSGVYLKIDDATRCIVTHSSMISHIKKLGKNKKSTLRDTLSYNIAMADGDDQIWLISESLTVSDGSLSVYAHDLSKAEINLIASTFGVSLSSEEAEKITFDYADEVDVGYKQNTSIIHDILSALSTITFP